MEREIEAELQFHIEARADDLVALQADLRRAGVEPWAWVINQSLAVAPTTSPLLQQRAANERARIEDVATTHARRYAAVGLQAVEPAGVERLAALAEAQASGVTA
jgi:arsenite-transporting ATPase